MKLNVHSLDKQKMLRFMVYSSCSIQGVNRLSDYTINSSVVILSITCGINNKCVCVVSACPGWLTNPDGLVYFCRLMLT